MLAGLRDWRERGGCAGNRQFTAGSPLLREVPDSGVSPSGAGSATPLSRRELFEGAEERVKVEREPPSRRGGCAGAGKILVNVENVVANPAYRFRAPRADKDRAAGDLRRSFTSAAAAPTYSPINFPSWSHIAQFCDFFRFRGGSRPRSLAKADQARSEAYE